jgi:hypothetical protein
MREAFFFLFLSLFLQSLSLPPSSLLLSPPSCLFLPSIPSFLSSLPLSFLPFLPPSFPLSFLISFLPPSFPLSFLPSFLSFPFLSLLLFEDKSELRILRAKKKSQEGQACGWDIHYGVHTMLCAVLRLRGGRAQ